jgi:hypothetical protein
MDFVIEYIILLYGYIPGEKHFPGWVTGRGSRVQQTEGLCRKLVGRTGIAPIEIATGPWCRRWRWQERRRGAYAASLMERRELVPVLSYLDFLRGEEHLGADED